MSFHFFSSVVPWWPLLKKEPAGLTPLLPLTMVGIFPVPHYSKVHDDDHDDMDLQPLWIRRNVCTFFRKIGESFLRNRG